SETAELRELALLDPVFIRKPCFKGPIWHESGKYGPGPGWYCNDGKSVDLSTKLDDHEVKRDCFAGIVWNKDKKKWICVEENVTKLLKSYKESVKILHRGDKTVETLKGLTSQLAVIPELKCDKRGRNAPMACQMLHQDHGKLMIQANVSGAALALLSAKDEQNLKEARRFLTALVADNGGNPDMLIHSVGSLESLAADLNPVQDSPPERRRIAAFMFNLLAEGCQAISPDQCSYISALVGIDADGLGELVFDPPYMAGKKMEAGLQIAWISSCTLKPGAMPAQYRICGGDFLSAVPNSDEDQAYAALFALQSLLREPDAQEDFRDMLKKSINPWLDDKGVSDGVKSLAKSLIS
ncbi:unnamed protein product, partial [Polarella glacialis]